MNYYETLRSGFSHSGGQRPDRRSCTTRLHTTRAWRPLPCCRRPGPTLPPTRPSRPNISWTLTANLDKEGKLTWEVPAGKWTILRIGHTSTGATSPRACLGLRFGMRQDEQGSRRGPFRRIDGQAHRQTSARWWANRSSPRTSTVGKTARRIGRPNSARSSRVAGVMICCRCCP